MLRYYLETPYGLRNIISDIENVTDISAAVQV